MSGPRILALVAAGIAVILWMALTDDPASDVERGLDESNQALERVEGELVALEPAYQTLTRRGVMLDLKAEYDGLRSEVAALRARRLRLADDRSLPRHEVLPAFRTVVEQADQTLAFAQALRRRVQARHDFILESSPLLRDGRALRDALLAHVVDEPVLRQRVESLAGRFGELESHAKRSDTLLQQNPDQGAVMASATLTGLREYLDEATALEQELASGR